jgi:hypothetical protein
VTSGTSTGRHGGVERRPERSDRRLHRRGVERSLDVQRQRPPAGGADAVAQPVDRAAAAGDDHLARRVVVGDDQLGIVLDEQPDRIAAALQHRGHAARSAGTRLRHRVATGGDDARPVWMPSVPDATLR